MAPDPEYLSAFLKEHDRDRYLASLVLKEPARVPVQAVFAFAADVAAIPARVSEPGPGEIRLQWWRDALTGDGHGAVRQNPLADALLDVIGTYGIPARILERLVAARRFDLYQDPMSDMATFEGYAGETVSTPYQIAAIILGEGEAPQSGDASGHLGVAHALIGHLRAFRFNAAHGRIYLPLSVFTSNGVSEQQILAGNTGDGMEAALSQLHDTARMHLTRAKEAIVALPEQYRPAFAHAAILELQWKRLKAEKPGAAVGGDVADWRKIVALTAWMFRNA